jgi:hypothetical protein
VTAQPIERQTADELERALAGFPYHMSAEQALPLLKRDLVDERRINERLEATIANLRTENERIRQHADQVSTAWSAAEARAQVAEAKLVDLMKAAKSLVPHPGWRTLSDDHLVYISLGRLRRLADAITPSQRTAGEVK